MAKIPVSAFDGVEEFDLQIFTQAANGWKVAQQAIDFVYFQHESYNSTVALKVHRLGDTAKYVHVYEQYEQSFVTMSYQLNAAGTKYEAARVFPDVSVNDFLMEQHQGDEMEQYKGNINFVISEKGIIFADLYTWRIPDFETIEDFNDVLIIWQDRKFVKEIIPVE